MFVGIRACRGIKDYKNVTEMNYNMIVCVYQFVSTHPILEHFGIHFPVVVFRAMLTFEEQPITNPAITVSSLCKNS